MQLNVLLITLLFFTLTGCANVEVEQRIKQADSIALNNEFVKLNISTNKFTLRVWKSPPLKSKVLRIYIEGDGFSWVTRNQPSNNPTPLDPIALKLAVLDKTANVAYLARPCQYIDIKTEACEQKYWAGSRFSKEVITSMNEAISKLKIQADANNIEIVGYSGGAAIGMLVASQRNDVTHVITLAGNIDHSAWTKFHKISPLNDSLNPPDYWQNMTDTRQTHFIGANDKVMPIGVYNEYRNAFGHYANIHFEIISEFDHKCCWVDAWPKLLKRIQ